LDFEDLINAHGTRADPSDLKETLAEMRGIVE